MTDTVPATGRRIVTRAPPTALHLLREMIRIRRFEERCVELYSDVRDPGIPASLHRRGGRAPSVSCRRLTTDDAVVATYREHGHALARGMPMRSAMAEMDGKVEGCSRGRGGSMHLFDEAAASSAATPSSAVGSRSRSGWPWPTACRAGIR